MNRHRQPALYPSALALALWTLAAPCTLQAAPGSQIKELLDQVPETARAAVVVDLGSFAVYRQFYDKAPEMRRELSAYLRRALGVDLTQITGLAIWATRASPEPEGAVFLRLKEAGTLKARRVTTHRQVPIVALDGKKVVAAALPRGVVLGPLASVKASIDLARRTARPLSKRAPLGGLVDEIGPEVHVLGGVSSAFFPERALREMAARFGVQLVTLSFDQKNRVTLRATGEAAKLRVMLGELEQLIRAAEAQLARQKELLTSKDDVLPALGAILGYHQWRALIAEARPREIGGKLVASYTLPEMSSPMMFTAVAGILAAVAIPAFIKYLRKAKTVEATEGIDKIRAGANAYFQADHYDKAGNLLPKQFPPGDTGWVPRRSCCGKTAATCQPDRRIWTGSPWRELHFALDAPHHFQFRYSSRGTGQRATFTVEARADLDCDGQFSSYKLHGSVGGDLSVTVHGPTIKDELE